MDVKTERYAGATEEADGYYQSPGALYHFAEDDRTYFFEVEDSIPSYAVSRGGMIDGKKVQVTLHEPYGHSDSAIGIPRTCIVFRRSVDELKSMGIETVCFYNRMSGGYARVPIAELGLAQPGVRADGL